MTQIKVLLVTKGHPFDRGAFFELFDRLNVDWTHVEQPAAQLFFNPIHAAAYDVFVMYDMPGIRFSGDGQMFEEPSAEYKKGFLDLLKKGKGMVFLHHAIAGWPAWPEYADIVGGRFLYLPQEIRGVDCQDSGYRHDVTHEISVVGEHEITKGLPKTFSMTDELYLGEVFAGDVEPLLTSDYGFHAENFYSAAKVVQEGKMYNNENWSHVDGSSCVGWTKSYEQSPIVYIQGGDSPAAYNSLEYQQLLGNAIFWASKAQVGS